MSGDPFAGAWRGRRVLVTGHTGFKGSWLATWLLRLGAHVSGYALAPEGERALFDLLDLGARVPEPFLDVRDAGEVFQAVEGSCPDAIFHLAAQALVRVGYRDPVDTFETNVLGTAHVLDAVRRAGRPCVVIAVTSDKCYEEADAPRLHDEGDRLGGSDPYSASKGAAELVIASYRRSFFPPERFDRHRVAIASVRAGNVIGGGDEARERLVPDIVRALRRGEPVRLRNPGGIRPWQHVLDALSGYLWLGARMLHEGAAELAEPWNFGPEPGSGVTARELTERVLREWGSGSWEPAPEADPPHETPELALAIDKATSRLGWRPVWGVEEAIQATVSWYRSVEAGADASEVTSGQIVRYTGRAAELNLPWATNA